LFCLLLPIVKNKFVKIFFRKYSSPAVTEPEGGRDAPRCEFTIPDSQDHSWLCTQKRTRRSKMKNLIATLTLLVLVPAVSHAFTFTLYYDWECDGTYDSTTITTYSDGTFEDGELGEGVFGIGDGVAYLNYTNGYCPLYVFSISSGEGYMKCTSPDGWQECGDDPGCTYFSLGNDAVGGNTNGAHYASGEVTLNLE